MLGSKEGAMPKVDLSKIAQTNATAEALLAGGMNSGAV